jgi:hypothetical protein
MPSDGRLDHQPSVYVLHRFANGGIVTKRQIREAFGPCRLIPCCTICNMGLGSYHGADDTDRREEIVKWFVLDDRFPHDGAILGLGQRLIEHRLENEPATQMYAFPGVGRIIYLNALIGLIEREYQGYEDFPDWLQLVQSELAEWLRGKRGRKAKYFLAMANLESYDLMPEARSDPRGQSPMTALGPKRTLVEHRLQGD